MKLRFEFGGAKYSAAGIFEFTKTSMTDFWREPFFHFYPDVDRKKYFQNITLIGKFMNLKL